MEKKDALNLIVRFFSIILSRLFFPKIQSGHSVPILAVTIVMTFCVPPHRLCAKAARACEEQRGKEQQHKEQKKKSSLSVMCGRVKNKQKNEISDQDHNGRRETNKQKFLLKKQHFT